MTDEESVTAYNFYFSISEPYSSLFDGTTFVWDALSRLPSFLEEKRGGRKNSEGSFIHTTVFVHPSAIVKNSYIGPGAKIYEGVVVRDSIIGAQTVIGHSSEIARSIVLDHVSIPRFDYVGA